MKALITTLIYGMAGIVIGLGGYLIQRFLAPKVPSYSAESQTPYECGEVPVGSAWQSWHWPFLPLATLLLLLEAEVLFALPWVWVQKSLSTSLALLELAILTLPIGAVYAYLLWGGYLFPHSRSKRRPHTPLLAPYQELQAYLVSLSSRNSPSRKGA